MSPKLRQAVHVAIDALLDAIEDERADAAPPKASRLRAVKVRHLPAGADEGTILRAHAALKKVGLIG